MTERRVDGLPFLPGNTFQNPTVSDYRVSHSLNYNNGYQVPQKPTIGIGRQPLHYNQLSQEDLDTLANFQPTLTYGKPKQAPPEKFVPGHVAFDKKVLHFKAYFKQTVHESANETYRVRPVDIYYYLEDDSISVIEPEVRNSGLPQGKILHRQRLPKNDQGDHYTWKDINMSQKVTFYGITYRVTDCDQWTRGYLESEGVILNPPECIPADPYTDTRETREAIPKNRTANDYDKLRQFIEMDKKVLRFHCVWDDRDSIFGELRPVTVHYYLVDDTMEVREVHQANDGRDPFPVMIGRQRCPKDRYNVKPSHPSIYMELSKNEIDNYFTPRDFAIGQTVYIYGRRVLVYDMDEFTKAFYYKNFGVTEFEPIDVSQARDQLAKMEIPPYNGFGTIEDSIQNCVHLIPEPAKKDYLKMMENDKYILRFESILDSVRQEDQGRRFIMMYHLADDMVTIYEPAIRNSGIQGGKFLEKSRLAKPGSVPEKPEYYGPQDFFIGATVEVFKFRFIVTGADHFVLKFMEEHRDQFPEEVISSLREKICAEICDGDNRRDNCPKTQPLTVVRSEGDTNALVGELRAQLRKLGLTSHTTVAKLFLNFDKGRKGYIEKEDIVSQLRHMHLPTDNDIVDAFIATCTRSREGRISLEEWRAFIEG